MNSSKIVQIQARNVHQLAGMLLSHVNDQEVEITLERTDEVCVFLAEPPMQRLAVLLWALSWVRPVNAPTTAMVNHLRALPWAAPDCGMRTATTETGVLSGSAFSSFFPRMFSSDVLRIAQAQCFMLQVRAAERRMNAGSLRLNCTPFVTHNPPVFLPNPYEVHRPVPIVSTRGGAWVRDLEALFALGPEHHVPTDPFLRDTVATAWRAFELFTQDRPDAAAAQIAQIASPDWHAALRHPTI